MSVRPFLLDVLLAAAVGTSMDIAITVADQAGARPLDAFGYTLGALMAAPIPLRRRWPLGGLLASSALLFVYYAMDYPGTSPAVVLLVPLYSTARAGRLRWAIGVPVLFYVAGVYFLAVVDRSSPLRLFAELLPHMALTGAAVLLGELVRSRQALAAETRERLRVAEESRDREAARRVAEERLHIARELHDTVAHSIATITVQAGSALHVLGPDRDDVRRALTAIRVTGKHTLDEIRGTLGMLREGTTEPAAAEHGLDRLPALLDAVRAAGLRVHQETVGSGTLGREADHAAYRILQESLTNVLRHAGPSATARIRLVYASGDLILEVTDDGDGPRADGGGGHGLDGMRERAQAVGGTFRAGPGAPSGFSVLARLPAETAP